MYQNQELLQAFGHCMTQCENVSKKQKFLWIEWSQVIPMCMKCFPVFVLNFIRDINRLVKKFERSITKWFQFNTEKSALTNIPCKTNEFRGNGVSRVGVSCFV